MRLKKILKIEGKIHCVTPMHIGTSKEEMEIATMDNPVIKNPVNGEPYVPGSSLKGRMRSLLEVKAGKYGENGKPCGCGEQECLVCRIFGPHSSNKPLGPTRIIVRDAFFDEETRSSFSDPNSAHPEAKWETMVRRDSGSAENPRQVERVPTSSKFDFEIAIQIFEGDNENEMVEFVKDGLRLVQETYLGGYGSRGSGKVRFEQLKLDGESFAL